MERLTKEELIALRAARYKGKRKNKYGTKRSGGYDSTREHRRACQLKFLERAGLISNLREQVQYELIPEQKDAYGNTLKPCNYRADFVYIDTETGQEVVEDSKGYRTDEYMMKRKLMLLVHGISILET